MDLTPDQDDALKQNLLKSFAPPAMPPIGPSSFDVANMGPNLDTTLKSPMTQAAAPVATPPNGGASGSWEPDPTPAPIKPATPTGAPFKAPEDPRIGSSHPGLSEDQIAQYLAAQKAQLNKYGPDQEAAVMDDIRKRQQGLPHTAAKMLARASDDVMQGVARAGSKNSAGQMQEADQAEIDNALKKQEALQKSNLQNMGAQQSLDQMDHNSPIGKAMISTWGPLLTKLGIPADKQAAMLPSLISTMAPELVKNADVMAKIKAAQLQKEAMQGYRQDQNEQNQWVKLGDRVNALTAGSRKALGISASNNMRADRLIQTAQNGHLSPQDVSNLTADLQGIYKGGTPDEVMQKHGNYSTLQQDAGRILGYLSSNPGKANSPEVVSHLKNLAVELKKIDNKVITDNLGINAVEFKPLIDRNPDRWHDMVNAVEETTTNPAAPAQATPSASFGTEAEAEKAGLPPGTVISIGGRLARVR